MRSLAPLSVCVGHLGGEVGRGVLGWVLGSGREENSSVHVLTKFSPPSHVGEFYFWMDGWIGVLGTGVFTFLSTPGVHHYIRLKHCRKTAKLNFPFTCQTHANPNPLSRGNLCQLLGRYSSGILLYVYLHIHICMVILGKVSNFI